MEVTAAVANILDFIDQLNCSGNTDRQQLRTSTDKRHREVDICGDSMNVMCQADVNQLDSQPLKWRYVQRTRKRAAAPAGAATEASVGGATVLVGSSSVRAAGAAASMGDDTAGTCRLFVAVWL